MYDAEKFTVCGRTTSKVRINKNKVNSEEVEEKESRSERHYNRVRNQILKSPNRVMVFWKIAMLFGLDGRCIPPETETFEN